MSITLSEDRQRFVRSLVERGRFASEAEVVDEALRLLRAREENERALIREGIRRGVEDMEAGRGRPAAEVLEEIGREFGFDLES